MKGDEGIASATALGTGGFYRTLAVLLGLGLGIIFLLGYTYQFGEFSIFEGSNAFWVGGLTIGLLSLALVIVLYHLGVTVYRVRGQLLQAMTLHNIIENNYAKLQGTTTELRREVKELRTLLAQAKTALKRRLDDE